MYRLSGDYNPLHVDSRVARTAGFDRPILRGSCTHGVALLRLVRNDPQRLLGIGARFSNPFYPGETIRTEIWRLYQHAFFRCISAERGVAVLDHGTVQVADT